MLNLVTGATGILGSHVVLNLIKRKENVLAGKQAGSSLEAIKKLFALHFEDHSSYFEKIKWIELDVRNIFAIEEALNGVNCVYHCAGFVSFNPRLRKKMFEINEGGTANMVNACLTKPQISLCHVSSIASINNSDYRLDLDEQVFWKTSGKESDYAWSKYNAEREVWRGIEEGLNAIVINPGVILSEALWQQSSNRLIHSSFKGNRFYTKGFAPYVWAEDVAEIMIRLLHERKFAERYILIENNYSFKEIMGTLQTAFHPNKKLIAISKITLRFVSIFENLVSFVRGKEAVLTKALIHSAFNNQKYSNKKICSELNYQFKPITEVLRGICKNYPNTGHH